MIVLQMLLTDCVLFLNPRDVIGKWGMIILIVLIMFSFIMIAVQHYFVRPTDIVISTASILLLLSPVYQLLHETLAWYWVFAAYNVIVLLLALFVLFRLPVEEPVLEGIINARLSCRDLVFRLGNKKLLWLTLLMMSGGFYYESRSSMFLVLAGYVVVVLFLDPEKVITSLISRKQAVIADLPAVSTEPEITNEVKPVVEPAIETAVENVVEPAVEPVVEPIKRGIAEIVSLQSTNVLLARMRAGEIIPRSFEVLGMLLDTNGGREWKTGLALDSYTGNGDRWLRILVDKSFAKLKLKTQRIEGARLGDVYLLPAKHAFYLFEYLVGVVGAKCTAEKIQFLAAPRLSFQQGELIYIRNEAIEVYFQVLSVPVMRSNDQYVAAASGPASAQALQLGCWDEATLRFEKIDWLAQPYSPIYKAEAIAPPLPLAPQYTIGSITGTSYPVIINADLAVAHHLAILGTAGTDKIKLSHRLISQAVSHTRRFLYIGCMHDGSTKPVKSLVSDTFQLRLSEAAEVMCDELGKQAVNQDGEIVLLQETILRAGFMATITEFIKGDDEMASFESPQSLKPAARIQYMSWFFNALYELSISKKFGAVSVCVVLENISAMPGQIISPNSPAVDLSSVVESIELISQLDSKYGLGLIVVDEELTELSGLIIRQCQSMVVFQQQTIYDSGYFSSLIGNDFISILTHLRPHQAIAVGVAFNSEVPMMLEVK